MYSPLATFLSISDILLCSKCSWGKPLGRITEYLPELPTKMGFAGKMQFSRNRFVRIAARYKLFRQATLQLPKPKRWGQLIIAKKNALHLPCRNRPKIRHSRRVKFR